MPGWPWRRAARGWRAMPELLDHAAVRPSGAAHAEAPTRHRPVAFRHESLVFRVAMGFAALWVLDDAFWHREPGTAVGDHLASGVVPVALAGLLALVYPRLRAGA